MTVIEADIQTDPGPLETTEISQYLNSEDQFSKISPNVCHIVNYWNVSKFR